MARVVAELGRPETAEETAARKAEFSRRYRSSKTFPSLLAAILATLAIMFVVVLGVPRGTPAEAPPIDVTAESAALAADLGHPVIDPAVPDDWRVNAARIEGGSVDAWTISYAPRAERGFLNIAQGFGASESWPAEMLRGATTSATVTIDGIEWAEYSISDAAGAGNISYALATTAGDDRVLVYGTAAPDIAKAAASAVTADIRELREATP
ncbi:MULTISPECIES: DUF4245 family protein [unclassified Microbacterium]|uniref:DUF4245 family protein n=1 Tax=unclassified Microbacterium TaxID=2609290 RepID=UPI000D570ADD|nr:DUF4245 family protein [Microbacterium sp. Gd 4-13]PVW06226.1 DUF4245 domain-containing protein [Microbacterium sp. Gd 4-13]